MTDTVVSYEHRSFITPDRFPTPPLRSPTPIGSGFLIVYVVACVSEAFIWLDRWHNVLRGSVYRRISLLFHLLRLATL